jgi:cytidylate kinase
MAIITISRGVQSGGRELAHRLEKRLGYSCLSREVISQCAKKYNIMESDLYKKLLEAPSRWRKLSREHYRYLIYVQCSLVEAAKQDNVIYHGYAGQLFLRGVRHAIKIRLEAPFEDRVNAEMREYKKSEKDAAGYIKKMDEQRTRWMKFLYNKDWDDPSLYDLSINLQNMSIDTICELVALLTESKDFKTTPESINGLNNLSLECEVRAAIASDDRLWNLPISVTAGNSVVSVHGMVENARTRDAIIDVVSQVKGVAEVKSYLSLPSDPIKRGIYGHD